MRKLIWLAIAVLLCTHPAESRVQSTEPSVSGTVVDDTATNIPGVTVTATNVKSGMAVTAITNNSGVYRFESLEPGEYKLSAALVGFKTQTLEVTAGNTPQKLNFLLSVTSVEYGDELVGPGEATLPGASVGDILSGDMVRSLPVVGNDSLTLLRFLPGVVTDDDQFDKNVDGATFSYAGLPQTLLHTTRDGITVDGGRYNLGAYATTLLHPDLIGEIQLILAPVDAELGRGNGQVRIQTRGGTNRFTGNAVWNTRNSALNANTWSNNLNVDPLTKQWKPTPPNWYNNHEYSLSLGGPVVLNKTFFFGLWDQQILNQRSLVQGIVLTDTARQGIVRYYDGWTPGNALDPTRIGVANPSTASVDLAGNPLRPITNNNGVTPFSGSLRCFSVFGNIKFDGTPFTQADCPGGIASLTSTPWDTRRVAADPTGYIQKILNKMPRANYFGLGDGLNRAAYQWVRKRHGDEGSQVAVGRDLLTGRKQFNIRLDDNHFTSHRMSFNWSVERNDTEQEIPNWPGGLSYQLTRYPQVLTSGITSTVTPSLLNEARFGLRQQNMKVTPPWEAPETRDEARQYMIPGSNGYLALINPGQGPYQLGGTTSLTGLPDGVMSTAALSSTIGNNSKLFTYSDTMSWTVSRHAFRFGAEVRSGSSNAYNNSSGNFPLVSGGPGGNSSPLSNNGAGIPGLNANAGTQAAQLLFLLTGSVNSASMLYWIDDPTDAANGTWEDSKSKTYKYRKQVSRDWSVFWKDDWKVTSGFTLNLGLRYEYYGSPYLSSGFTSTTKDQGDGLWGDFRTAGGNPFDRWLRPGNVYLTGYGPTASAATALKCVLPDCDPNTLTTFEFVGAHSPNPTKRVIRDDKNNWGPAIGFSWQLPWFGNGKTTLRGGYQLTYGGNFGLASMPLGDPVGPSVELTVASWPGSTSSAATTPTTGGPYLDLTSVPALIPVKPTSPITPGRTFDAFASTNALDFYAFDARYATPYVQNLNLSVSRTLARNVSLELRYIGTMAEKQIGVVNLNTPNVYHNKELFDALELTRAGGTAPLFDQMFAGLNLNSGVSGYGTIGTLVNGVLQTGSAHLRRNGLFGPLLANGSYAQLATQLGGNGNNTTVGLLALPTGVTGVSGRLLRNGCDRIASGQTTVGTANPAALRCFPENYIKANTQLNNAYLITNSASSNYNSMQAQISLRPTRGFTYIGTYTLSKALGVPGLVIPQLATAVPSYTDPSNREADYAYTTSHRRHDYRGISTFEVPVGPGRFFFGNSSGWLARLVEGWQTSVIFSMNSGGHLSADATTVEGNAVGLYGSSVPDVVRRWPTFRNGKVEWVSDASGNYATLFGMTYYNVPDPQCGKVTTADNLRNSCTLAAIAEANSGEIVLQNPNPGTRGNMGLGTIELPGNWNFDANFSKSVHISNDGWLKSLQFRVDMTNVLNHPKSAPPGLNINDGSFGFINNKGDQVRSFQGQVRLQF